MKLMRRNQAGFSLIELTVVMVIIAVMLGFAMQSMTVIVEDTKRVRTQREMEMLSRAITGDPDRVQDGQRADFGYVGDIGAFPVNLNALYTNPGGLPTWDGPYIQNEFTQDTVSYRLDDWGAAYTYSGGVTITSPGGGSAITEKIADASSDYLLNTVTGIIKDKNDSLPGSIKKDSVNIVVTFPRGASGNITRTVNPNSSGAFTIDSLPAGVRDFKVIYKPLNDTLKRNFTVLPRHKNSPGLDVKFASAHFGSTSSSLTFVASSDTVNGTGCASLRLWIVNNTGASRTISTIRVTWAAPTAYYSQIVWNANNVFNLAGSPRGVSGTTYTFSSAQTINSGSSIQLRIEDFRSNNTNGGGGRVSMSGRTITILLSDGSTFTEVLPTCP
ncbi:MAG: type II secretion system protein [candidate division Zixibacteria bacterium]|nr:type II secretion system protein [candidate division Zixibacteria bacterium]